MNILVTGGAGFIGSHLCERLLDRGDSVFAIDNFDSFYPRSVKESNIAELNKKDNFRLEEIDILDYNKLNSISFDIDCIVHLAGKAGVRPSIKNPVDYQKNNVEGTQNLLEFARERDIKQFVFASSSSVYGVNENVPWSEDDHVLKPISPYASTKISSELLGHVYSTLYNIRFLGLRFFTVYGPRQRPDLAIHKFIKMISEDEAIPVFGDGTTRRDYTFVSDIVDGIVGAIDYDKSIFEIINIGNHNTISLADLISEIEKVVGKKAIINRLPMQPGDVPQTYANIDKAKNLLSYEPNTTINEGLTAFYNWYINKKVE